VLVQETGFSDCLETGRGLLAFRTPEEALAGIGAKGDINRFRFFHPIQTIYIPFFLLLVLFGPSYHDLKTQVQLRMAEVKVAPLFVSNLALDGARLRHPFTLFHAADLLQEVCHAAAVRNEHIWLDRPGAGPVAETGTQSHRDEPAPRHQADEFSEESQVPGIPEREPVQGELDPPTEMLTALIQRPVAHGLKMTLLACLVQALDFLTKLAARPDHQGSSPDLRHRTNVPFLPCRSS
jgi:hypothetical protein